MLTSRTKKCLTYCHPHQFLLIASPCRAGPCCAILSCQFLLSRCQSSRPVPVDPVVPDPVVPVPVVPAGGSLLGMRYDRGAARGMSPD